jgi:Zn-dependent metalloprotease
LSEHVSDAFGIMVKQFSLNQAPSESDWLIGAGLFTEKVKGKAIRSMAAPGTAYDDPVVRSQRGRDPQPAHMRDYVVTSDDNGGVHINSGIPNHAFYLAAIDIGVESWSVLGRVWYATLTQWSRPDAEFQAFADATGDTAGSLFGVNGHVQQAIRDAWAQVGLPPSHPAAPRIAVMGKRPAIPATADSKHAAYAPKWRNRPAR